MLALAYKVQQAIDRGVLRGRVQVAAGPDAAGAGHPGEDPFRRVGGWGEEGRGLFEPVRATGRTVGKSGGSTRPRLRRMIVG